ncbi:MAG: hypothetical protein P4L61_01055 [Candidatus Pacebacteria bacterium]|nr:hypothetical protein [Candidatus Paceibacterota bacterium]
MWSMLILLTFSLAISQWLKAYLERKDSERKLLMEKWKTVREQRISWQESHPWLGFDNADYQELWEIEIGAEDLYLLCINGISPGISWSDYCFEKKSCGTGN